MVSSFAEPACRVGTAADADCYDCKSVRKDHVIGHFPSLIGQKMCENDIELQIEIIATSIRKTIRMHDFWPFSGLSEAKRGHISFE